MKQKEGLPAGRQGYSLLEAVIYIAILSVVAVIVVESVFSLYRAYGRSRVDRRINLNGDYAIERIIREIREATSTDPASSSFGISPGILAAGGKTFSLAGANGPLQVAEQNGSVEAITSDVDVMSLYFYRQTSATAPSEIIKVEIILSAGEGSFTKTRSFYGRAVLRKK